MRYKQITVTCLCLGVSASLVMAEEKKQGGKNGKMDMQKMMQVYEKVGTPGPPHGQLASMAGSWNTKTKSWMEPKKPPM